jgi:hypothetical protein
MAGRPTIRRWPNSSQAGGSNVPALPARMAVSI